MTCRIHRWTWLLIVMGLCPIALVGARVVSDHFALGSLTGLAYSSDGSYVAAIHENGKVTLWDPATGNMTATIRSVTWGLEKIAISHDGKWIASVQRIGNEEGKVRIYETATGTLVDCLTGGDSSTPVAFHPSKPWLVWIKDEEAISIWDVSARREVRRLAPKKVRASALAFSREGQHLALGILNMEGVPDNENVVLIWDLERDRLVSEFKGLESFATQVSYSPDGKRLGSISLGGSFRIWDLKTGTASLSIPAQTWATESFSFSPDGTRISIGLGDGSLREHSASDGHVIREWANHPKDPGHARYVGYDPRGSRIAYSADKGVVFKPIKP